MTSTNLSLEITDDTQAQKGVFRVSFIASSVTIVIQILLCARNNNNISLCMPTIQKVLL